jgi:hypothetical protein
MKCVKVEVESYGVETGTDRPSHSLRGLWQVAVMGGGG